MPTQRKKRRPVLLTIDILMARLVELRTQYGGELCIAVRDGAYGDHRPLTTVQVRLRDQDGPPLAEEYQRCVVMGVSHPTFMWDEDSPSFPDDPTLGERFIALA